VGDVAGSSTTTFTLIFLGLMFLAGVFLWITVLKKPLQQNLTDAAATQYGEDFVGIAEIVAKDMVPKFPHMPIDQLTELVMTAIANKSKTNVKLYEMTVRQIVVRLRGQQGSTAADEPPASINRWTD
jgi:hypothetical protein